MMPPSPDDSNFFEALAKVPLFANLEPETIRRLAGKLRRRMFLRGAVVVWQGDPGATLYLIESGQVKVVISSARGQEAVLKLLGPGDFFGDIALFDGSPRTADVVTIEDSWLLLLEREALVEVVEDSPRLALGLLAAVAGRVRDDVELLQSAAFLDGPGRLARVLLKLADALDPPTSAPVVISQRLTQTDLAGLVGASRESVNKWLKVYEDDGAIERRGSAITIMRPDALRRRIV